MRHKRTIPAATAIFAAAVLAAAQAPAPNPVVAHYRAYRAAIDAGDLATAETEADAALAASVAREGDGGRTAVLAMNLAQVRLDRGRAREAHEPAMRAFNIASANGAASGVDPLVVRLALGRAELAARAAPGEERLVAALVEADSRPEVVGAAHAAAAALGDWAMGEGKYGVAQRAWARAGAFAAGSPAGATFGRGQARVNEAISFMLFEIQREPRFVVDTRLPRQGDYAAAEAAFVEGIALLRPLALANAPVDGLTLPQRLYAQALAWRTVMHNRLRDDVERRRLVAEGRRLLEASGAPVVSLQAAPQNECAIALVTEPEPRYPPGAKMEESVGSVIVRVAFNEAGEATDVRVAAALPARWFADAVSAVAPQWRASRAADNPPDCVMPRAAFVTTSFRIVNM